MPTKEELEARIMELEDTEAAIKEKLGIMMDESGNEPDLIETVEARANQLEELTTKVEATEAAAALEDTSPEAQDMKEVLSRPTATFPEKVAAWLTISRGKRISAADILITDIDKFRVHYRFRGNPSTFGILLKFEGSEDLKAPPDHSHGYIPQVRDGITLYGEVFVCECGKSQPSELRSTSTPVTSPLVEEVVQEVSEAEVSV